MSVLLDVMTLRERQIEETVLRRAAAPILIQYMMLTVLMHTVCSASVNASPCQTFVKLLLEMTPWSEQRVNILVT